MWIWLWVAIQFANWPAWVAFKQLWFTQDRFYLLGPWLLVFVILHSCMQIKTGQLNLKNRWNTSTNKTLAISAALLLLAITGLTHLSFWLDAAALNSLLYLSLLLISFCLCFQQAPLLIWQYAMLFSTALPLIYPLYLPLQHLAVLFTEILLPIVRIPFHLDGTLFQLHSGQINVAQECSGIKYMMTSLSLAMVLSIWDQLNLKTTLKWLMLFAIVAIVCNWIRIALLLVLADVSAFEHPWLDSHDSLGWIIYALSLTPLAMHYAKHTARRTDQPVKKCMKTCRSSNNKSHFQISLLILLMPLVFPNLVTLNLMLNANLTPISSGNPNPAHPLLTPDYPNTDVQDRFFPYPIQTATHRMSLPPWTADFFWEAPTGWKTQTLSSDNASFEAQWHIWKDSQDRYYLHLAYLEWTQLNTLSSPTQFKRNLLQQILKHQSTEVIYQQYLTQCISPQCEFAQEHFK
jgi:exosortase